MLLSDSLLIWTDTSYAELFSESRRLDLDVAYCWTNAGMFMDCVSLRWAMNVR